MYFELRLNVCVGLRVISIVFYWWSSSFLHCFNTGERNGKFNFSCVLACRCSNCVSHYNVVIIFYFPNKYMLYNTEHFSSLVFRCVTVLNIDNINGFNGSEMQIAFMYVTWFFYVDRYVFFDTLFLDKDVRFSGLEFC